VTAITAQLAENLVESIGHIAKQNLTLKSGVHADKICKHGENCVVAEFFWFSISVHVWEYPGMLLRVLSTVSAIALALLTLN
jgi:hypothetical protein